MGHFPKPTPDPEPDLSPALTPTGPVAEDGSPNQMKRPLTWSYGLKNDITWKLHVFNDGYRTEARLTLSWHELTATGSQAHQLQPHS